MIARVFRVKNASSGRVAFDFVFRVTKPRAENRRWREVLKTEGFVSP